IGKPASITSTPSRASWWAISSFSCLLSEMPGDCSPSRKVVSKILTRSCSLRSTSCSCSLALPGLLELAAGGRHALFPPKGEKKEKAQVGQARHGPRSVHHCSGRRGRL